MTSVRVRVPATTANLGPGFDCLGLALDLWNEAEFELGGDGVRVEVAGLGAGRLPLGRENLIAQMALHVFEVTGQALPAGLQIRSLNRIPPGAGLGSSASAVWLGLLGGNALAGSPLKREQLLTLAIQAEGHPDNAAAALYGGLVISASLETGPLVRCVPVPPGLKVALAIPDFELPTHAARRALPAQVPLSAAVFNLGRTALVVEALRSGDLDLLGQVMQDQLHQPYRLKLIPGAQAACEAALQSGAKAVALSGAGPSLVAFAENGHAHIAEAMLAGFQSAGLLAKSVVLDVSARGATILA